MGKTLSISHKIAFAAMLLAFNILATRLLGFVQPAPIFSFNRLGISSAITIFSSIFLGPVFGCVVGVGGDALGWLLMGQWTGTFNVFLSVYYALIGIVPYFMVRLFGKKLESKSSIIILLGLLSVLFISMLSFLWLDNSLCYRIESWNVNLLGARIFVTCLCSVLFAALIAFLIIFKKRRKATEVGMIYWTCAAVELLAIFAKPLAFYLFCLVFLGTDIENAWHVSYSMLVMLSCVFAIPDLIINVIGLRLLFWSSKEVVRIL